MKILIADSDPETISLIHANLRLEGYDTLCAYTGQEAVEIYAAERPDVVLLELLLPDLDGCAVLQAIQKLDPAAAVIFVTADTRRTSKILGLELGADDYIVKPFDTKELVLRVKALWRRIRLAGQRESFRSVSLPEPAPPVEPPHGPLSIYGILALDEDGRTAAVEGSAADLTFREFDLLCYLARNRHRVLSRETLLENVWGYSFMGSTRAVDILIQRLRQKLGPAGAYIKTVYGVGYRFEVTEPQTPEEE